MKSIARLWKRRSIRYPAGVLAGAGVAFAYYWYVGCAPGGG